MSYESLLFFAIPSSVQRKLYSQHCIVDCYKGRVYVYFRPSPRAMFFKLYSQKTWMSPSCHPNPTQGARTLPQHLQSILQSDWPHPNLLTRQRFHSGKSKLKNNQGLLCFLPHQNPLVEQLYFSLHQNPLVEQGLSLQET